MRSKAPAEPDVTLLTDDALECARLACIKDGITGGAHLLIVLEQLRRRIAFEDGSKSDDGRSGSRRRRRT